MKKRLVFVVLSVWIVLLSGHGYASPDNALESLLLELRTQEVTIQLVGKLYKQRNNAPDAEIQASVVRACAAGLLYLGKNDTYQTSVRGNVPDVATFEKSLLLACPNCDGTGKITQKCTNCNGARHCTNNNCYEGLSKLEGFDGRVTYRPCVLCKGTGKCPKCEGTGSIAIPCTQCRGVGGVFQKSTALTQYRNELELSIAAFETRRKDHAEQLAQAEFKTKIREIEIQSKREAIAIEAKAAGEERARQEAIAIQEEIERKRREAENEKYATIDKDLLKSIVIIEGDRGVGTGFLCNFKGKNVLLSNAHVLFGNRSLRLRTTHGKELEYSHIYICKERDIAAYHIINTEGLRWLNIHKEMSDINNQEPVVIFGNSAGGGVATTLRGKMQGIGPESVEVDAQFVKGNSGSPIIAYPYNAVVGMATYTTQNPKIDLAMKSTRFAETRRFGVRIDNVNWTDFLTLNQSEYSHALDVYDRIVSFAAKEISVVKWLGDYYQATGSTKFKAGTLLQEYRATPEWMRKFADEATLAAYFCSLIR